MVCPGCGEGKFIPITSKSKIEQFTEGMTKESIEELFKKY
jgi:hypothetical protein